MMGVGSEDGPAELVKMASLPSVYSIQKTRYSFAFSFVCVCVCTCLLFFLKHLCKLEVNVTLTFRASDTASEPCSVLVELHNFTKMLRAVLLVSSRTCFFVFFVEGGGHN